MRRFCQAILFAGLIASPSSSRMIEQSSAGSASGSTASRLATERNAVRGLMSGEISLPEAVRQAGGRLTLDATPNPDYFRVPDLESLTKTSQIVVLARPYGSPRVQLSDDGRSIVTQYEMLVDTMVRPDNRSARLPKLTVEVPGGDLTLKEGIASVVNGPRFTSGDTYVLFLQGKSRRQASLRDVFVVTGFHYEGILRVDGSSTVGTSTTSSPRLKQQSTGRSLSALLAEIRATS